MRRIAGRLIGWLGLLLALPAWAAPQLRGEVVLMRHGVRAPTSEPDALGAYASQPWPQWPVAAGQLSSHGVAGMQALGQRYRQLGAADGLLPAGCPGERLRVVADSTPRNRASAAALLQGLAAGCPVSYLATAEGTDNPLFHYPHDKDDAPVVPLDATQRALLHRLQYLLLDCSDPHCLGQWQARGKRLLYPLDGPVDSRALKLAGGLAENLMLEYAQGMPANQVGWGRLDVQGVQQLIGLHNLSFALSKRLLPMAAQGGSNLLAHILGSLQAMAGQPPVSAPMVDAQTRWLLLLGHDTNLAEQAGLLGLDWPAGGPADDYPPGGALVFQLWQDGNEYRVRLQLRRPTLQALRQADFRAPQALYEQALRVSGCPPQGCTLDQFVARTVHRWDASAIDAALPSLQRFTP